MEVGNKSRFVKRFQLFIVAALGIMKFNRLCFSVKRTWWSRDVYCTPQTYKERKY